MIKLSKEELAKYLTFFDVPPHIGKSMLPSLSTQVLERGKVLISAGEICEDGYMILQGGMILSHVNPDGGKEKVVNFFLTSFQPFCAVWDSFFTGKPSQCKLFTFTDTIVISLHKSEVQDWINSDPQIMNFYLNKINNILIFENNLRIKLLTSTPEQFYNYLLTDYPKIIKNIPSRYIAEFMGISREWLSKIKSARDNK